MEFMSHRHLSCLAPTRQATCLTLEASLFLVQELSEDVLAKVFETRQHLPDWATLRLVSKRWNATVNSCADRVSVKLTAAEWRAELAKEAEEWAAHQPGAELAFARLCYVL